MSLAPTTTVSEDSRTTDETTRCPECDGTVRPEQTEDVCQNCGLVVDENRIDPGPEWRQFADDETNPERTGAPRTVTRHDRGLSTKIGNFADYKKLSPPKRQRIARLRRQHHRANKSSKRERNQVYSRQEVRRIACDVDVPQAVRERACALLDDAQEADLFIGRDLDGFAAAVIYTAARLSGTTRSIDEVASVARVDRNDVRMCFTALNQGLGLELAPPQPREYLPRFASHLDLPHPVEADARRRLDALDDTQTVGKNPCGVAAAALYVAARDTAHEITQADAGDVGDVSAVTLRGHMAALEAVDAAPEAAR